MAAWYAANLGFSIRRGVDTPVVARFMADASGSVMLEVYYNPKASVPDYSSLDPTQLHIAVLSADVPADALRLVAAGATLVSGPEAIGGDVFAMLRDPWGMPLQLVRRGQPMLT